VKLKAPRAPWLATMADEFNVIANKETIEPTEAASEFGNFDPKYIVGTGPYVFDKYDPTKQAHAVKNPDYFLKKAGQEVQFFDEIFVSNLGTDINAQRTAFEQKQIDELGALNDVITAITGARSEVKKLQVPNPNSNLELGYNISNNPAFKNPQLRKAIFIAVDRPLVAQQQFQGLARPTPAIPWAFTDWSLPQTELANAAGYRADKAQDLKEAQQLWSAGGGPALTKDDLTMIIVDTADQTIKEWFPAMMNKNLNTDKFSIRSIPVASLLEYDRSSNSVGYLGGWDQWTSPDPRQRFADVYSKSGNINFWHYFDEKMEDYITRAMTEMDKTKAIAIMKDAQRLALGDGGAGHLQMVGAISQYVHWP
jgi:ABC-type transport system substrate-binding protein